MIFTELSKYLYSYISWSYIALLYSQHYAFARNYVSGIVNQLHSDYLGEFNRKTIATYAIWLKLELQLSGIFKQVKLDLHTLLANEALTSSAISNQFKQNIGAYPLTIDINSNLPSHIIYLTSLLNVLHKSEKAFYVIEHLNVHHNQNNQQLITEALIELPSLVDDLFELVELIDHTPQNLELFLIPIQQQLIPKLQFVLPALETLLQKPLKKNFFTYTKKLISPITSLLSSKPLDQKQSRELLVQSIFQVPALLHQVNEALSNNNLPLSLMNLTQLHETASKAYQNLELFIDATNDIKTWFYYIECIKEISTLGGSLINNAHRTSKSLIQQYEKKLRTIKDLIPKGLHELSLLEINLHLATGLLTKPATLLIEQTYALFQHYARQLLTVHQTIEKSKPAMQGMIGKLTQKIINDPIAVETLTPLSNELQLDFSSMLQTHHFLLNRQSLLSEEKSKLEHKLHEKNYAKTMLDDFYSMLENISDSIEFQRKLQLTVKDRLRIANKYKFFQPHVVKLDPDLNQLIYKHLEVSPVERLKLIAECGLTQNEKSLLANALSQSHDIALEYIDSLTYDLSVKEALALAINNALCKEINFTQLIPLLPQQLVEEYLPWCWFDELSADDLIYNNVKEKPSALPFSEQSWSERLVSTMSIVGMAFYGLEIIASGLNHSCDLHKVLGAKKSILKALEQDICDSHFCISQIDEQIENVFSIKHDSITQSINQLEQSAIELHHKYIADSKKQAISKTQKDELLKNYKNNKTQIEEKIKQLSLPQKNNAHIRPISLPENYQSLSLEKLNDFLSLFSIQSQLLESQKKKIHQFYELLENNIVGTYAPIASLSMNTLNKLKHLLLEFQASLNFSNNITINYEQLFIDGFHNPTKHTINDFLQHRTLLLNNIESIILDSQAHKSQLAQCIHDKKLAKMKFTTLCLRPDTIDVELLPKTLFKSINDLKLDEQIHTFRTQTIITKIQDVVSKKLWKSLSIENLTYPITDYHQITQTEAIYKHILNALYHLEEGVKSFHKLQKLSESTGFIAKSMYITIIIQDLIINLYSAYYYLHTDQKHPQIQIIISEVLKIIEPLQDVPIIAPYIENAKNAAKISKQQAQTNDIASSNIVSLWHQQMLIIRRELGKDDFNLSPLALKASISTPTKSTQTNLELLQTENKNVLYHAYLSLEKLNQKNDGSRDEIALAQKASERAQNTLAFFEKLSITDPETVRSVIVEMSELISQISNAALSGSTLNAIIFKLTERSLNKLYRISDNIEISLGTKPNIISDIAINHFFTWLNDLLEPLELQLNTSCIKHQQHLVMSCNKRIYNLESKIKKLRKEKVSKDIYNSIFNSPDGKEASPFQILCDLEYADFSNTPKGCINKVRFLKNYATMQPHLCVIDYSYDKIFFLRDKLQSANDFNMACRAIKNLKPQLQKYVTTFNKDISQKINFCNEHISSIKKQRRNIVRKVYSIAQKNHTELENKNIHHNSMLARMNQNYLNYHRFLANPDHAFYKTEEFLDKLQTIEVEREKAILLYDLGQDMIKIFNNLLTQVNDQISERDHQYLHDKKLILNNLILSVTSIIDNEPGLTLTEQKNKLQETYEKFEQAKPILTQFTNDAFIKFFYDCISYISFRLNNLNLQIAIDNLFIKKPDLDFTKELHQAYAPQSKLFKFFDSEKNKTLPQESLEEVRSQFIENASSRNI